jgi:hypothetical protein
MDIDADGTAGGKLSIQIGMGTMGNYYAAGLGSGRRAWPQTLGERQGPWPGILVFRSEKSFNTFAYTIPDHRQELRGFLHQS